MAARGSVSSIRPASAKATPACRSLLSAANVFGGEGLTGFSATTAVLQPDRTRAPARTASNRENNIFGPFLILDKGSHAGIQNCRPLTCGTEPKVSLPIQFISEITDCGNET